MLGIGLVVCFLAFRSFNGHAASDGDFTLREAMQFLHLCSIATWSGGVIIAGLITAPCLASANHFDDLALFGRRLSQTITVALAIVIATGIYNSWEGQGGSLVPLPHTPWGRMLLLKLSFVLLALGHGARVRFLLKAPLPWTDRQATIMRRWLRTEAMLMIAVIVCSAWLANLPPGEM
ncbi:copper resistance D family protein [Acidicapsa dinghuensis]|uniref:copper resistance D family protein n=1 Tax=Acidicapsa dinghuensis TaxID=2218256 RepID=UPI0021DF6B2B|nr:CopD family protein [Acidicapsa dinghuensis]